MNRVLVAIIMAALLMPAAGVFAQDTSQPSEQRALDNARAKYKKQHDKHQSKKQRAQETEADDEDSDYDSYTPVVLAFAPGLQVPMGIWDTSFSAAYIGVVTRDISGFQGAGVFNIADQIDGFQAAGVFNIAKGVDGFQGAGVFNIVNGSVDGFQGAGVFNIAKSVNAPLQAAGVFNIADRVAGFQAGGVFNIADNVAGGQMAGVLNVARHVGGLQMGLINVADVADGAQIGLLNFARNAVNSFGVYYEPAAKYSYAYYQAGTPFLYSVMGIGLPSRDWFRNDRSLRLSFGLGSRIKLNPAYLDVDVSAESAVGSRLGDFLAKDAESCTESEWKSIWSSTYPALRLSFGLPVAGRLHLVGGLKVDFDLVEYPRVPEDLKVGKRYSNTLFGVSFVAWPKWFIGVKI